MFNSGLNQQQVLNVVQNKLINVRKALQDAMDLGDWSAGITSADLVALGFSQSDADTLRSAMADASALALIYETGLPPGTYPQPTSAYVYSASQRQVMGPQ